MTSKVMMLKVPRRFQDYVHISLSCLTFLRTIYSRGISQENLEKGTKKHVPSSSYQPQSRKFSIEICRVYWLITNEKNVPRSCSTHALTYLECWHRALKHGTHHSVMACLLLEPIRVRYQAPRTHVGLFLAPGGAPRCTTGHLVCWRDKDDKSPITRYLNALFSPMWFMTNPDYSLFTLKSFLTNCPLGHQPARATVTAWFTPTYSRFTQELKGLCSRRNWPNQTAPCNNHTKHKSKEINFIVYLNT